MNIIDAANATVHDYLGGSESLGPRIGLSAADLRSKLDPGSSTQHLTIAEADRIMELTGDFRMLRALAHQHGFLLVESPDPGASDSDMERLEQAVGLGVASGELRCGAIGALADSRINEKELRATHAAQYALQAVAAHLAASCRRKTMAASPRRAG
jgi:hypothetical protein